MWRNWPYINSIFTMSLQFVRRPTTALCLAALMCLAPVSPASSQSIDGIINLMGRAIEHDMRRKEAQRQHNYQVQQQRQRDQQERQRRQAEIDTAREQEIEQVKRIQRALAKLGFYASAIDGDRGPGTRQAEAAYTSAFRLPTFNASEEDVEELEHLAARGFRSAAEYQRATAGNFETRDEMVAAEAGGFTDFAQLSEAKTYGFTRKDEYEAFRASGLKDRSTFLQAKEQASKRDDSQKACVTLAPAMTDPLADVGKCLTAVRLGVRSPELIVAFKELEGRLLARKEEYARSGKSVEPRVAELGAGASTMLAIDKPASGVDEFKLAAALKGYDCGAAMLAGRYDTARLACASESADPLGPVKVALQKEADEKATAAEADVQRAQEKIAATNARQRAVQLVNDLQAFTATQNKLVNGVDVAKALVAVRQSEGKPAIEVEQANQRLDTLLAAEPAFQTFLRERERAAETARTNAKATADADLAVMDAFLSDYIAKNVLHEKITAMIDLQTQIQAAQASQNFDRIIAQHKAAQAQLATFGLSATFDQFRKVHVATANPRNVQAATNGLAISSLNEKLLVGDERDVLILGNFTPAAPNLIVNLLGKTAFEDREALLCWYGELGGGTELARDAIRYVQTLGIDDLLDGGICDSGALGKYDLVAFRRGDFLAEPPADAAILVAAFEKNEFRMIHAVTWSEAGRKATQEQDTAAEIEADILGGARQGYGIIRVSTLSDTACLMVSEAEQRAHLVALDDPDKDTARFLQASETKLLGNDVEQTFIRLQRQQCVVVYGDQGQLKLLIEGMKRQNISYSVAPVWISPEDLASATALVQENDALDDQALAARKQAFEAEATLAAAKRQEAEQVRAREQAELRRRYGQEATAALNRFNEIVRDFFVTKTATSNPFSALFPKSERANAALLADKWQVDPPTVDLLDYGTAEWKGRRAEVIFATVKLRYKNNLLGQYREQCYTLGYLIDAEFSMLRDAVEANCGDAVPAIASWKNGRRYESRWVVSAN